MVSELIRRRLLMAEGLPYDAEISYLQGDGSAYIDLGIKGNRETHIYLKFIPTVSSAADGVCGWRGDNSNSLAITSSSGVSQRFGSQSKTTTYSLNVEHEVSINKSGVTIDGSLTSWNQTASFTTPYTLRLFMVNTSLYKFKGKIIAFSMLSNDTPVFDMIPVRIGQVGYMYDKVSKQLFGNAGSGSFILGNDV